MSIFIGGFNNWIFVLNSLPSSFHWSNSPNWKKGFYLKTPIKIFPHTSFKNIIFNLRPFRQALSDWVNVARHDLFPPSVLNIAHTNIQNPADLSPVKETWVHNQMMQLFILSFRPRSAFIVARWFRFLLFFFLLLWSMFWLLWPQIPLIGISDRRHRLLMFNFNMPSLYNWVDCSGMLHKDENFLPIKIVSLDPFTQQLVLLGSPFCFTMTHWYK